MIQGAPRWSQCSVNESEIYLRKMRNTEWCPEKCTEKWWPTSLFFNYNLISVLQKVAMMNKSCSKRNTGLPKVLRVFQKYYKYLLDIFSESFKGYMEMRWLNFIFSVSQNFLSSPETNAFPVPRGEMQGKDIKLSDILEFILEGEKYLSFFTGF